jgi:hypothetical protein
MLAARRNPSRGTAIRDVWQLELDGSILRHRSGSRSWRCRSTVAVWQRTSISRGPSPATTTPLDTLGYIAVWMDSLNDHKA